MTTSVACRIAMRATDVGGGEAGTIVVSTLDPISHDGGYFVPTTGRFLDAFLPGLSTRRRN